MPSSSTLQELGTAETASLLDRPSCPEQDRDGRLRRLERPWRQKAFLPLVAVALALCCLCGIASLWKQRSTALSSSSSVVSLLHRHRDGSDAGGGSDSSGSDFAAALQPQVLGNLWKVERMLVDSELCPAATQELEGLRRQRWPREHAGKPPKIGKILYINLAWDMLRRNFMEKQLRQLSLRALDMNFQSLEWEHFEAVDAEDFQHASEFEEWRKKGFSQSRSPKVEGDWRTAACLYSHYAAIDTIPDSSAGGLVIISEDDVEFDPRFLDIWEELWPYVPAEWDVLRLGWFSSHQNCSQTLNSKVDRAGWQTTENGECAYCGMQAYIVNPASKHRVLERLRRSRMTHADELLGAPTPLLEDSALVPPIRSYVVWPMLAKIVVEGGQVAFRSDRVEGRKAVRR